MQGDSVLWVSTAGKGVFSFDVVNEKVKNRLMHSGNLQSDEFFQHAQLTLPNGDIIFGSKGGAEVIYTHTMDNAHNEVEIYLGEVSVGQQERVSHISHPEILDKSVFHSDHIRLPYGER